MVQKFYSFLKSVTTLILQAFASYKIY